MSDHIMSSHPYSEKAKAEDYAAAIAAGIDWRYETVFLGCRRCKQGFTEVVRRGDLDIPLVCGNCQVQLRSDCFPDPILD